MGWNGVPPDSIIHVGQHFIHNDLHMNNIIYDYDANSLALLDFGRSYINGYNLSANRFRCVPHTNDSIPVMIDIVDDMYMRYFRSRSRAKDIF